MVVHQALDLSHTVREAHVVEIDFVKAELLDRFSGQFHVKLPNLSVISAWPIGFVMLVRLSGGDFGDGAVRIVLHEIGILEAGDSSHHVEPFLVKSGHCPAIELLAPSRGSGVVRRGVPAHRICLEARTFVILYVYDEGVDLSLFRQCYVGVDVRDVTRREINVERIAGLRHYVILKQRFFVRVIVTVIGLSASETVPYGQMQRIVDLGLVSGQCALPRAGKILPVDIAFEVARLNLIAVHLALMVGPSAAYDL